MPKKPDWSRKLAEKSAAIKAGGEGSFSPEVDNTANGVAGPAACRDVGTVDLVNGDHKAWDVEAVKTDTFLTAIAASELLAVTADSIEGLAVYVDLNDIPKYI